MDYKYDEPNTLDRCFNIIRPESKTIIRGNPIARDCHPSREDEILSLSSERSVIARDLTDIIELSSKR